MTLSPTTEPHIPVQTTQGGVHQEDWHLQPVCPGYPNEGYEITNGDPRHLHGCVSPFVLSHGRAALMAAAPAMYRALQASRDALAELTDYSGGADNALCDPYVVERAMAALDLAHRALATAGQDGDRAAGGVSRG